MLLPSGLAIWASTSLAGMTGHVFNNAWFKDCQAPSVAAEASSLCCVTLMCQGLLPFPKVMQETWSSLHMLQWCSGSTCGDVGQEWDALSALLLRWAADPDSLMPRRLSIGGSTSISTTRDLDTGQSSHSTTFNLFEVFQNLNYPECCAHLVCALEFITPFIYLQALG
jgi:hypothetical protein